VLKNGKFKRFGCTPQGDGETWGKKKKRKGTDRKKKSGGIGEVFGGTRRGKIAGGGGSKTKNPERKVVQKEGLQKTKVMNKAVSIGAGQKRKKRENCYIGGVGNKTFPSKKEEKFPRRKKGGKQKKNG